MAELSAKEQELDRLLDRHIKSAFDQYENAEKSLIQIFLDSEAAMAAIFPRLPFPDPDGGLSNRNVAIIEQAVAALVAQHANFLLAANSPGIIWTNEWSSYAGGVATDRMQQQLAFSVAEGLPGANLSAATFANFSDDAVAGVVRLGREGLIRSFNLHGNNLATYFDGVYRAAMTEGIPVVGPDSLANILFEDGVLRDLQVQTSTGVRRISAETRAKAWARTELNRIENEAYIQESLQVGMTHYKNRNPMDRRTSDVCRSATRFGLKTIPEWRKWARANGEPKWYPPRHVANCRSRMKGFKLG